MARLAATLLFAALASAEYTTTVWMTKVGHSDKYGYVASVVDADAQHITMVLNYDSDTNQTALHVGDVEANYTFGPSSFIINQPMTLVVPSATGDVNLHLECTQPAQTDDDVQCTQAYGDQYARLQCGDNRVTDVDQLVPDTTTTFAHTYGTGLWGPSGVETITWTIDWPDSVVTTTPAWCTSDDVPASAATFPYTTDADAFAVYQVVVTAGEEKLSAYSGPSAVLTRSATASAATAPVPAGTASIGSSGSVGASATTSALPEFTGAAGKMSAVVPALAGVGVAAVMGML